MSLIMLPTNLAIKIASQFAVTSEQPMDDVHSLQATYSSMCCICGDPAVGRRLA